MGTLQDRAEVRIPNVVDDKQAGAALVFVEGIFRSG